MHSKITEETSQAWELLKEGQFKEAYDQVTDVLETHEDESDEAPDSPEELDEIDEFEEAGGLEGVEETEEVEEDAPPIPGASGSDRPPEYWDSLIVKMLSTLAREEDAETWDAVEKLLPCGHPEMRNIAVGIARLSEGLLIKRMEEMGSTEDSHKSLEKAAEDLEDNVLTFQGNVREDADVKDRFLAAFARILGRGKWDQMKDLISNLEDQEDPNEDEEKIRQVAGNIMELERRCTPEKIEEVKEAGMPHYYRIFMELMEWGGSDLDDLEDLE